MSGAATVGAVVYAKDVARVSAFYAETCALRLVRSEADHVVLERPAFELVIVAVPERIAKSIEIASPPVRREGTPIKLVFEVASIDAVRARAPGLGGALNPPEREWRWHGRRVCDGHDPEGNVVQFREEAGC